MKKIIYLNNYLNSEIMEIRKNKNTFSQAANNKILGIKEALISNGCNVKILSSAITNNKSGKYYKKKNIDDVTYCGIIDLPLINTVSSIIFLYMEIKKISKKYKIDNIIFYNFKPEVAWAAWLAKLTLKIPIIVEYEDGYSEVNGISRVKKIIFNYTEKFVKKRIDGAILVTSKVEDRYKDIPSVVVRGVSNATILKMKKNKKGNEKIRLMFSGGLDEERGIKVLLESLNYTSNDFELIISGRGPLEELIKNNNDKRIKYLGFIEYNEMINYMVNSDILINAQLSNNSFGSVSFPSKIFEYISTGNIIISSNVSDVDSFANDAMCIYNADNSKELAMRIDEAIKTIGDNDKSKKVTELAIENLPQKVGKRILNSVLRNSI